MKKALLFLFLFTSLPFYSQIADLRSNCNSFNNYDLTRQYNQLIGYLDPPTTVISYHLSLSDATNGINAIVNPEYYSNSQHGQIIYARINNEGLITVNYFNLVIGYSSVDLESLIDPTSIGANDGRAYISIMSVIDPLSPYVYYCSLINSNGDRIDSFTTESKLIPLHNLAPGDYRFTLVDRYDCYKMLEFKIAEIPLNFTTSFTDKNITVAATGGFPPYQYFIDNNTTSQSSNIFSGLDSGLHTITVTDSSNRKQTTKIWIGGPLVLNSTTSSNINCYGDNSGSLTVNATGGTPPYIYSKDGNNYTENNIFNNLVAGSYSTYVKDAEGIIVSNISTITQPATPLSFTATTNYTGIGCGKKVLLTIAAQGGQAPYTYSMDGINYVSNNIFSDLHDTYTFCVKDSNECINTQQLQIYPPKDLTGPTNFSVTNVSCNGGNDGSLVLEDSTDDGPFTYEINGQAPKTGNIISGLSAGEYRIGLSKPNFACGIVLPITITQPATPLSITTTRTDAACPNKGSITATATGGQAPYIYSIDGINYLVNNVFSDLQADNYTVWVKDNNGCISTQLEEIFDLIPPLPMSFSVTNVSCNGGNDGSILFDTDNKYAGTYTYEINGSIPQTGNIISGLSAGTYFIGITNSNAGCGTAIKITITEPNPLYSTIAVENQNITIIATGGTGLYEYSLDGAQFQSSNIFNNALYGDHEISVRDQNECVMLIYASITPPAPLIDGKDTLILEFTTGQTLGDLVVEGQNIKWYSSANPSTGKTAKSSETSLPLTTVLVDGVTYYASQTINGVESKERLAVTVKLDKSLSAPEFVLSNFKYYPNPVQHSLTIDNTSIIDEIEILSVSGKSILTKKINNTHSEIDLSNVSTGFYFLKVRSEGQVKMIKIVKK